MVSLHLVRTDKLDPRLGRVLSLTARSREDADYDPMTVFTSQDSDESLAKSAEFFDAVRSLLLQEGWLTPRD